MSGTSGLSDDLKKAMTGYIDACKLVSAGQVSADDCAFNAAREDVELALARREAMAVRTILKPYGYQMQELILRLALDRDTT